MPTAAPEAEAARDGARRAILSLLEAQEPAAPDSPSAPVAVDPSGKAQRARALARQLLEIARAVESRWFR